VSTYLYRCTEQQLESHLQRIADAGDTVEHVIYKGGRDYVLVCRKAGPDPVPMADPTSAWIEAITEAVSKALVDQEYRQARNASLTAHL
jgi:hypothetical protein